MKILTTLTLLLTLTVPSFAGFSITYSDGYVPQPHYYQRYYRRPHYRPVVVAAPVYYASPVPYAAPAPVVSAPASGDYGQDLASLHEKISRLRAIVQKQKEKDGITPDQYDRFMNALDGIEHDEHARSYDRGGYLSGDDFADLFRRADQAGEDIELALAQ